MTGKIDYKSSISKARRKRNRGGYEKYFLIAGAAAIVILLAVIIGKMNSPDSDEAGGTAQTEEASQTEETLSPEEQAAKELEAQIDEVIASYDNLGIAQVSGYLNIRETPDTEGEIIGKLMGGSGCEIEEKIGRAHV